MNRANTPREHAASINKGSNGDREHFETMIRHWLDRVTRYSFLAALPALMASSAHDTYAGEPGANSTNITGQASDSMRRRRQGNALPHQKPNYFLPRRASISAVPGGRDECPGKPIPPGTYTAAAPFTDTGDTTGSNSTISGFYYYYYWSRQANGPDQVFSFTLTSLGTTPQIQVTAANPDTYKPLIYVTTNPWYGGCPTGTGTWFWYPWGFDDARFSGEGGDGKLPIQWFNLNQRYYVFIDSHQNDALGSGAYTFRLQDVTIGPSPILDFDGDGRSDPAVFQEGSWRVHQSSNGDRSSEWGLPTDDLVARDYDGDGKADEAIFRDGEWWVKKSSGGHYALQWGLPGDKPVPADYDGDGKADHAIYRAGDWWILNSSGGHQATQWGLPDDQLVQGDYDGDGKADPAIFRDGVWWIAGSTSGHVAFGWGLPGDIPVPADYDGDGKTDPAVFRSGTWWILKSSGGHSVLPWGLASDVLVPADYDGDGKADPSIFRDGVWWILRSTGGHTTLSWGKPNDRPATATGAN